MKILLVHGAYQQRGGEDAVVADETRLLGEHGHDVRLYRRDNAEIETRPRWRSAVDAVWSRSSEAAVGALVDEWRPDVVHLHNTFPLISPSVVWAARRRGCALVATLHNVRLACLEGSFMRDGSVCRACLGKLPWRGVAFGCYRGSRAASAVLASSLVVHRALGSWQQVHRFIVLGPASRELFITIGLPAERLRVKPNFAWPHTQPEPGARRGGLYVGRLTRPKGAALLADALRLASAPSFTIVGDGPDAAVFDGLAVRRTGALPQQDVPSRMAAANYLVLPSVGVEQFPRVLAEAYAAGLPVIAARRGALAERVEPGRTGLLFEPESAQDLATQLRWAEEHPAEMRRMGEAALATWRERYSPAAVYTLQMAIYDEARRLAATQAAR